MDIVDKDVVDVVLEDGGFTGFERERVSPLTMILLGEGNWIRHWGE